ncbi:MAG: hypothetical protein DYG93_12665 [Leptolyngbya sp. PLA2]|nr:hypothetical protein [Leptolyngbya sp.]MCE7972497.1 hypothetical protein [Leptolyngbya sp. PL-A2]MCQ3941120.1 hypothetical protein [cyanobacterium CYA1]MCZ7633186.1 hypothetical protein [Phycisphaerales bacterium]MDL1905403.1 hypothetical protein [Synechococcales cyanobacterium CNB]GIK18336.1 MAG: hypothetical protein BroJett004_05000 [Planctomycetota bacterium]
MTAGPTDNTALSPAGLARRDRILSLAQGALRARVRRRITVRAALAALPLAVAIATGAVLTRQQPKPAPLPIAHRDSEGASEPLLPPVSPGSRVEIVRSDPSILQRTAIVVAPSRTKTLDDRALADALAQAGLPAGVIRTPDRVTIAPIVRSAALPPPLPGGDPGALPAAPTG